VRPVRDLQMREGSSTSRQSPRPRRRAFTNVSHWRGTRFPSAWPGTFPASRTR